MRDTFAEWYWPDDDDLREIVSNGLIVLDSNVLLDLYRHSAETREALFSTLEHDRIRPRLRLTYQAGLEFHRNRLRTVGEHKRQYDDVLRALRELEESPQVVLKVLFDRIGAMRDPGVQDELNRVARKATKRLVRRVRRELKAAARTNVVVPSDVRVRDEIRDRIERLFSDPGQVGYRPSSEEREEREKDVRDRLRRGLPPGTEDKEKEDGGIGDPLIWLEMKSLAVAETLPVLFVSGDAKRDWIHRTAGEAAGPLPALRQEFAVDTGQSFHSMKWGGLLENARKYLDVEVAAETVEVVEADEREADRRRQFQAAARAAASTPTSGVGSGNAFADLARQAGALDPLRNSTVFESILDSLRENITYPTPSDMFSDFVRQKIHARPPSEMFPDIALLNAATTRRLAPLENMDSNPPSPQQKTTESDAPDAASDDDQDAHQ
ncbi:PIN-like domain-containing protein [Williamsia serinedens]|uniref:PIN like domain-containing protein n=1 Tax=Williamsia serinedens TaxID=391736 RepID=A0ABT1H793_9NOCA|nr:PIN-like domain-containing protein [Williamsia serinedens]MCP2163031.1 hypothetical protein [Williamsia serinedens]